MKKFKIGLVELNNKNRKGTYVYVYNKGYGSRYYKFREGSVLDSYKKYYVDSVIKKNSKGSIRDYVSVFKGTKSKNKNLNRNVKRYIKKIKTERKPINKVIKSGITEANFNNVFKTGAGDIKNAKIKLFNDLVLDKELLNILILDENLKKIKSRFEYRLSFVDKNGELLADSSKFNDTMENVVDKLKKNFNVGEDLGGYTFLAKLKELGFVNIEIYKKGYLNSIRMKVIFRKGK